MIRYMHPWVLATLKVIVVAIWIACLWGQVAIVPAFSEAIAGLYISQSPMRWPYLIMGDSFLLCVEVAFMGVWRLFSLSGAGTVFTAKAMPYVNLIIGSATIGGALTLAVGVCFITTGAPDPTMQAMDYWSVIAVLTVTLMAELGFILLMIVMKGLLRAATDQSDELKQVI